VKILHMDLQCEVMAATGNFEQLRILHEMRAAPKLVLLSWGRSAWVQNQITPGTSTQAAPAPIFCKYCLH
jgi:hypothetical protein